MAKVLAISWYTTIAIMSVLAGIGELPQNLIVILAAVLLTHVVEELIKWIKL